jgi:ERCC4-related helicase
MDTEVRARIESKFVEQCSKLSLDDILLNKEAIMKTVRDDVTPYFKDRGINITVIGLKGEFTYLNPEIQASIDRKFKSAQDLISQDNENKRVISKANADAEAIRAQASTMDQQIKLKSVENQAAWIQKWNGTMPQYTGDGANILFGVPGSK